MNVEHFTKRQTVITSKLLLIRQYEVYSHRYNYLQEQLVYKKANAKERTITKVLVPILQEPSLTLGGNRIFPHSFWEALPLPLPLPLSCQQVFNYKINPALLYPFFFWIYSVRIPAWLLAIMGEELWFSSGCAGEIFWGGGG